MNLDVCAQIVDDGSVFHPALRECLDCCTGNGFTNGNTLNDGKCVCGSPPADDDPSVCSSAGASDEVCKTCCDGASFLRHVFDGQNCTCSEMEDKSCLDVTDDPDGFRVCQRCCLEHGNFSVGYYHDEHGGICTCSKH